MLHPQLIQSMHGGQQDRVFNLLFASANSLLDTSHMGQLRQGFNFKTWSASPNRRGEKKQRQKSRVSVTGEKANSRQLISPVGKFEHECGGPKCNAKGQGDFISHWSGVHDLHPTASSRLVFSSHSKTSSETQVWRLLHSGI